MNVPPLAILQARMGSKRLPGKVLMDLGGQTILARIWRTACDAFGPANVVVAYPDTPDNTPILEECRNLGAEPFGYSGDEDDVLGRFYECAHLYRWHPDSVIVRVTCDDPFKSVSGLRRVASGQRLPVEIGGEAFTLKMLDQCHWNNLMSAEREHITPIMFAIDPPPCPPGVWTIDTPEQLETARAMLTNSEFSRRLIWIGMQWR